jgi:hypothetical protein
MQNKLACNTIKSQKVKGLFEMALKHQKNQPGILGFYPGAGLFTK